MRNKITFLIAFSLLVHVLCVCFCTITLYAHPDVQISSSLPVSARSAILVDWNSGRILYEKNAHEQLPNASTTKIMTAVVALENGDLNDIVVTSENAAHTGGSSIWLDTGEVKTLEELLYGLMLRSGNDAAVAIAEHISGSVTHFSNLMSQRAHELGSTSSSFKNPHGLHHPDHYTTAYDLSIIASHAMGMPLFKKIVMTPDIKITWPGHPWDRRLFNQNKLLDLYPGGEGIKTGWTTPAGRCFVGSASRDGRRLISVVLNAPNMWEDTENLLNYGFDNFSNYRLIKNGQYLKAVPVIDGNQGKIKVLAGGDFVFPLKDKEGINNVSYRFTMQTPIKAPVVSGERVGELEIYYENQLIGVIDLISGDDIERRGLWERIKGFFTRSGRHG